MTAELRNLPHIASMAFNEPLMLEPAYARVFFCALAGQLGISRLTDAVSGDSLTAQEALATLALSGDDDGPRQARSYQVMNGIAVLPVSGTLVSRTRALQPYSGMTGYNGIIARLQQAASDRSPLHMPSARATSPAGRENTGAATAGEKTYPGGISPFISVLCTSTSNAT